MIKLLKNTFTGKDNETLDIGRILWAVSVVAFIGIGAGAVFVQNQVFDPAQWGLGAGAVLAGGGGAIGMKAKTEPDRDG